ncbi:MAG: RNA methyltransferase [Myxococcales bacterium]|nr:RNA methyltransferase [Myxococcales bacterium]
MGGRKEQELPRNVDNLLAIARVMQAFGWTDWVAVSTAEHLDGMLDVLRRHRARTAAGALVSSLPRVDRLEQAIADCSLVVGTTMRVLAARPRWTPRELASHVAQRRDERWALVFGAEANGLQNDDLAQCHALSFIPTSEEQPSLNLAQAVVVYAHELSSTPSVTLQRGPALAEEATLRRLKAALARRLRGGARGQAEELMATLQRASLTAEEAATWLRAWEALG